MKRKLAPLAENVSESAAACLVTMVQGNIFAVSLTHVAIASGTGLGAGLLATVLLATVRAERRATVAAGLGATTAFIDFAMHPGGFGPAWAEAAVTGLVAGALSWAAAGVLAYLRRRRVDRA